ncbi:unnamed protein product [Dibothriocephalus latus]|uniref:Uncharacterized protein n=1 Tax=Dibothriocephalus latus TaxID=60516 RepID=A0A3P7QKW2_DIBLA|nr:unnamed protein product [Dibothriocephalus latus]
MAVPLTSPFYGVFSASACRFFMPLSGLSSSVSLSNGLTISLPNPLLPPGCLTQ